MKNSNFVIFIAVLCLLATTSAQSYYTYASYSDTGCTMGISSAIYTELDKCVQAYGKYSSKMYTIAGEEVMMVEYAGSGCTGSSKNISQGFLNKCVLGILGGTQLFEGKEPLVKPYAVLQEYTSNDCSAASNNLAAYKMSKCIFPGQIYDGTASSVENNYYTSPDCTGTIINHWKYPLNKCVNGTMLVQVNL